MYGVFYGVLALAVFLGGMVLGAVALLLCSRRLHVESVPAETEPCASCAEWEQSFALYDSAVRRGTELWRAETGRTDVLPDTAKLVAWLIGQLSPARWQGTHVLMSLADPDMVVHDAHPECDTQEFHTIDDCRLFSPTRTASPRRPDVAVDWDAAAAACRTHPSP